MFGFVYIVASSVNVFISLLTYVLLARVILQLFVSEDSKAMSFCYALTEPLVSPVRKLLYGGSNSDDEGGSMLDFSYLVTFLLLTLVQFFLKPVWQLI